MPVRGESILPSEQSHDRPHSNDHRTIPFWREPGGRMSANVIRNYSIRPILYFANIFNKTKKVGACYSKE